MILHGVEQEGQALRLRVLKQATSEGEAGKWVIPVFGFKNKSLFFRELGRRPSQEFKRLDQGPKYWDHSIVWDSRKVDY